MFIASQFLNVLGKLRKKISITLNSYKDCFFQLEVWPESLEGVNLQCNNNLQLMLDPSAIEIEQWKTSSKNTKSAILIVSQNQHLKIIVKNKKDEFVSRSFPSLEDLYLEEAAIFTLEDIRSLSEKNKSKLIKWIILNAEACSGIQIKKLFQLLEPMIKNFEWVIGDLQYDDEEKDPLISYDNPLHTKNVQAFVNGIEATEQFWRGRFSGNCISKNFNGKESRKYVDIRIIHGSRYIIRTNQRNIARSLAKELNVKTKQYRIITGETMPYEIL